MTEVCLGAMPLPASTVAFLIVVFLLPFVVVSEMRRLVRRREIEITTIIIITFFLSTYFFSLSVQTYRVKSSATKDEKNIYSIMMVLLTTHASSFERWCPALSSPVD